ncbi:MAG: TIM barrel protein [Armatimonadota bacterium]|nr:TIM barrel protein [Armatimonadota bacterium]
MRLGISSYTYTWAAGVPGYPPPHPLTAGDLLARAVALGVRVVQIADNLPLHTLSPADLDDFARRAQEAGVAVEVGTRGIAPDHLRQYLQLAVRFRSPILRVVVDTAHHHPSPDEVVSLLRPLMPEFAAAKVALAIENHDRFAARVLARIVQRLESPYAGICLDTVNSFGALEGPAVVVPILAPLTLNLHVKDFAISRVGSQMGFTVEGTPAGQGRLNIPWVLEELRVAGRDPNAILELWTPFGSTLEETIAREREWAELSVRYLRTLIPH